MSDPIAVVGLACRLPGAADPEQFWDLLRSGGNAISDGPRESCRRATGSKWRGGFVDRVDEFDADFFGISPREARAMDPQQRLALELAWEAIEDAGIVAESLRGTRTGVFAGVSAQDYAVLMARQGADRIGTHTFTGLQRGLIANRVSYAFGLNGPSLAIDSAQSSSLVAIHVACESLRRGESEAALAVGINLILAPDTTNAMAALGALSPDGRCAVFDEHANGYVRGEGAVVALLKPLRRAVEDGNDIYCVVVGSATNNDGGGRGLTVPDRAAQEDVLRSACTKAGIPPHAVGYVELHGTGTPVGDPVEAEALSRVFGAERDADDPLRVGSVKTNIGHLEGAAGIAGFLKVALCIRHRALPATLHHAVPSPQIPLDAWNLRVQTGCEEWTADRGQLIAGVSSFGIGGTNAHVILAEPGGGASAPRDSTAIVVGGDRLPWVLSARTPEALLAIGERLKAHLSRSPRPHARDIGLALATTRSSFDERAVVLGTDSEIAAGVSAVAAGRPHPSVVRARAHSTSRPVFVFPGQGSHWAGMAAELWQTSAPFREHMTACERALAPHVDWSLAKVIADRSGEALRRPEVAPPVLFSVLTSLARLWQACGVEPGAVLGASQGEIAAAYIAGALPLHEAVYLIVRRSGVLAARVAERGTMLWLGAAPDRVEPRLAPWRGRLALSGVNGPNSVTVCGGVAALDQLAAECTRDGIRTRWIPDSVPTHGPLVEPARDELLQAFDSVTAHPSDLPYYSSVYGRRLLADELDAQYWYRMTRQPVRFADATRAALADGHTTFLELGPHPSLGVDISQTADELDLGVVTLSSLRRGEGGPDRFLAALAEAWTHGVPVQWEEYFNGRGARRVKLPSYPFQRRSYWLDEAPSTPASIAEPPAPASAGPEAGEAVTPPLHGQLLGRADHEQLRVVTELVRAHVAAVLGHAGTNGIDLDRAFRDLGVDSQMAVQVRNRLADATELRLPTTLLFEHSTVRILGNHLCRKLRTSLPTGPTG